MLDIPVRLVVAYGLIAAILLVAAAIALWTVRNSRPRRNARARAKQTKYYRMRAEAAAEQAASDR